MTAILHRTVSRAWLALVGLSFLGLAPPAEAALVEVKQESSPVGHASNTEVVETGTSYQTIQPNLTSNGYVFGYWKTGTTRLADAGGRSVTQATVTVNDAMTITAHYFLADEDTDSDGVMDWFEYRNFGNLAQSSSDDADGDGFDNGQENALGQEATIKDQVEDGGISSRTSSGFVFADTSMVHYVIKSDPVGFITGTDGYMEVNATVSTSNLHGETNGYHFAYWTVNGVRIAGPTGVAMSQVSATMAGETTIVANYVASSDDVDSDGVMDWYELNQFGNLASGPSNDSDGDGFTNEQESTLGQEATIKDQVEDGGISSRTSPGFVFADNSMVHYVIKSDPIGFITTSDGYVEVNATVSTSNLHGATNGYDFSYWTVNGVRIAGPTGVAMSQVNAKLAGETAIVAHYFPSGEDVDSDGVMDWYELNQFGNLAGGPSNDSDGDGFTNEQESALGQEATIKDQVEDGGISSRVSGGVIYFMQVNKVPDGLDLNASTTIAGKPAGLTVGTFTPHDDDDPNAIGTYDLSLVDGNGSTDNIKFAITGRDLKTNALLALGTYSIRVRVADDENASLYKNFTIQAIHDPNKDDDNDSLTYAQEQALGTSDQNPDSDGDGFSDLVESNYGSNPTDANSTANAPPTDLNNSTSASFFENQPIGTLITDFNATDPDVNATLTYSISGSNAHLFTIDQNGTLFTHAIFDFETNASVYNLSVRVTDEHNASQQVSKNIILKDINETPISLSLSSNTLLENQPVGTVIGEFNATDLDANSTLSYALVDGNGSSENSYFNLDTNGSLACAAVFDYENNESNFSIRVQVRDEHNASLEKAFVINLLNEIEDLDSDGIEDFYDADDDGDGFSDISESAYGSDPRDAGSVANSAPSDLVLNDSGILENQPIGAFVGLLQGSDPDVNASLSYSLVDGNGSIDNILFSVDANGSLSSAVVFDFENNESNYSIRVRVTDEHNASLEKAFTISLLNEIEDLDGDGIEDFYDADDDNDGFSDANEIAYGSDPRDAHSLANAAPASLDLNGSVILENQPIGAVVGLLHGSDPDANASLSYSLVDGNGSIENSLFNLDTNGTLSSAVIFDYETNASNYSVRVKVTDEHNAILEKPFAISLLNEIEDLDGDGIEDFYDADDDNDGFSDAEEIAYGSDPRDAHSVANAAPSDLDLNGSAILENQPIDAVVGLLQGSDPDVNASLSYSLVDGIGSKDNPLFSLDENGTLRSAVLFDYETNASNCFIRVRVTDEHNAYLEKTFAIILLNEIEDLDEDGIEDFYDADDDNDGFSDAKETAYGSDPRDADSVANAAPSDLDLNGSAILENQPIGAVVGLLQGIDPDANAALSYSLVDGIGSKDNPLFSLDENGTLRSAVLFDYEKNGYNRSIRARVTDEHNASLETVFAIRVLDDPSDDLLPWVRGLNLHFDENGTPTLSFEAGTEHGAELLETGILLTFAGDQQRFPADLNGTGDPYLVSLDGLQPGQAYRYQAYARNQVGETLSAMGKLSIGDDSSPWWVETDSDGWVRDSWMGSFLPTESGWLFHARLGWIYAQQDEVGGLWIWLKEEGWLWSRADLFPFLYSNDRGNWFYLLPERSDALFYDYATETVR